MKLGPVSETLEKELRNVVRRHGIVVWLDADARYTSFVDGLATARGDGALPYEVRAFRGSFLELMLELAPHTGGVDKELLLIHLPGFNEESVVDTPLLELYRAGTRFRKGLDTLVSEAAAGRVPPPHIAEFVTKPGLSLEAADEWLSRQLDAPEGGISGVIAAMSAPALVDDLLSRRGIASQIAGDYEPLFAHFASALGLPAEWRKRTFLVKPEDSVPSDAAYVAASWAMAVEYVDDLARPPRAERLAAATMLPAAVVTTCCELAKHLRSAHPDFYEQTARQTQDSLLSSEATAARAADLGKIDTFPFEDEVVLDESLEALRGGDWVTADGWTRQRVGSAGKGSSFWLERRPSRKSEWQLIGASAALGLAIEHAGNGLAAKTLDDAAERYASVGAAVDGAHRHLEQLRHALLYGQLDRFEDLRTVLDQMREHWRAWADAWARDFSKLCRTEGFLPSAELQQRGLFEEVVRPLAEKGATAFFVVDALRYEMGEELLRTIADSKATEARLAYRLAELPSNTEIGMNVLAPVAKKGRLECAIRGDEFVGFSSGEFRVSTPDTRKRAMQDRIGGATCPWLSLDQVLNRGASSLKTTVSKAKLVVVHSQEIDKAGEGDFGPKLFEYVLRQLRTAWRLLRDAGVKHFVISADHGFLLLHDRIKNAQNQGRKIDPHRRHVLTKDAGDRDGTTCVALADLLYDGVDDWSLIFPETTVTFDTGQRGSDFVHGGNSLQERMIPVLTVVHRGAVGGSSMRYRVEGRAEKGIGGMHRLALTVVVAAQEALDFARDAEVELALQVSELPGVEVDLIQAGHGGRIEGGSIYAPVGQEIEVFFRLHGRTDARVQVEVFHPGAAVDVEGCLVASRFAVAADGTKAATASASKTPAGPSASEPAAPQPESEHPPSADVGGGWLEGLPEGGVRKLFAHLADHGTVSEAEATRMFGSARKLRRFSGEFEAYAALAPFSVRIEMVAGVKTYVRDGSGP